MNKLVKAYYDKRFAGNINNKFIHLVREIGKEYYGNSKHTRDSDYGVQFFWLELASKVAACH